MSNVETDTEELDERMPFAKIFDDELVVAIRLWNESEKDYRKRVIPFSNKESQQ